MSPLIGDEENQRRKEIRRHRGREERAQARKKFRRHFFGRTRGILVFLLGVTILLFTYAKRTEFQNFISGVSQRLAPDSHMVGVLKKRALQHEKDVNKIIE